MSRIESGKIVLDEVPCNLSDVLTDLDTIITAQVESRQQKLTMELKNVTNENILCDKTRLKQVLQNLLSNAVKYTQNGGQFSLTIEQLHEINESTEFGSYEFRVQDNGIGMSEEFVAKVFDEFERENTSTVSGIQDTGLGMAITKGIIDMMGGTISLKTEKNKGTEFIVRVHFKYQKDAASPVQKETALPESVTTEDLKSEKVSFDGKRLLLVDDVDVNREIAAMLLTEQGFIVEQAVNGKEAVNKVKASEAGYYDAVLMDIQMPVMNGYEATKAIRELSDKGKAEVPVVAMTANAFDEDIKNALNAGMDAHIAKPIDEQKLLSVLTSILNG